MARKRLRDPDGRAKHLMWPSLEHCVRYELFARAPLDSTSKAKKLSNFLTRGGRRGGLLPKMRAGADERPPRIVGEHFDAEEANRT